MHRMMLLLSMTLWSFVQLELSASAPTCPPVLCEKLCEHGFVKNESGCDTCQCKALNIIKKVVITMKLKTRNAKIDTMETEEQLAHKFSIPQERISAEMVSQRSAYSSEGGAQHNVMTVDISVDFTDMNETAANSTLANLKDTLENENVTMSSGGEPILVVDYYSVDLFPPDVPELMPNSTQPEKDKLIVSIEGSSGQLNEGDELDLRCVPSQDIRGLQFAWIFTALVTRKSVTLNQSPTYFKSHMTPANSGNYSCGVSINNTFARSSISVDVASAVVTYTQPPKPSSTTVGIRRDVDRYEKRREFRNKVTWFAVLGTIGSAVLITVLLANIYQWRQKGRRYPSRTGIVSRRGDYA